MTFVIIQARMGSTRLPGKVLKKIDGVPLLGYQLKRVEKATSIDKIVVATTNSPEDDMIVSFCEENGIEYFRGSENDVLSRYYECAKDYKADVIVRLTADCPLSDPKVIDDTVNLYFTSKADFAANTVPPETSRYPDGLDVEVFGFDVLARAYKEAANPLDREHVTFYFWKHSKGFKTIQLKHDKDYSKYRLTVDYPEDFEVVEFIIKELKKRGSFGHMAELIEIIESSPKVKAKNSQYFFGIGWKTI